MIDQVDRQVEEWIRSVVGEDVQVTFDWPTGAGPAVSACLLEIRDHPPPSGGGRPPLQVVLRYLVSAVAERAEAAHRLLGELVFAALEHPEYRADLEPVPARVWVAAGVAPRPSFLLRVPCRKERPAREAPRVLQPLVVRTLPTSAVAGRVLGPDDFGIAGARVELPALRLSTRTDGQGRFRFAAVPAEPVQKRFVVHAKGVTRSVVAECIPGAPDPVLIRIHTLEG